MSGLDELTREELESLVIKLHETVETQAAQIEAQAKRITELEALVQVQAERISELEEQISKLGGPKSKPTWVKANAPKKEKGPRKKRSQSFSRGRLAPTEVVYHAVDSCPDCGRNLTGGTLKWSHQVVEIPETPVKVTDHLFIERHCGACGKRFTPNALEILGEVVVGKKSMGISLMSLVAYLKIVCRVPVNLIRQLLSSLYGLKVSKGEICELLHEVARIGKDEYANILEKVRGSPVVHGDETGWREEGVNGYVWSFSTPQVRYFTYNHSRAGSVVKEVLDGFEGALVSDFYGGYNIYDGVKQRCWIHYLRDLAALAQKHECAACWVDKVKKIYYLAKATTMKNYSDIDRCRLRWSSAGGSLPLAARGAARFRSPPDVPPAYGQVVSRSWPTPTLRYVGAVAPAHAGALRAPMPRAPEPQPHPLPAESARSSPPLWPWLPPRRDPRLRRGETVTEHFDCEPERLHSPTASNRT